MPTVMALNQATKQRSGKVTMGQDVKRLKKDLIALTTAHNDGLVQREAKRKLTVINKHIRAGC